MRESTSPGHPPPPFQKRGASVGGLAQVHCGGPAIGVRLGVGVPGLLRPSPAPQNCTHSFPAVLRAPGPGKWTEAPRGSLGSGRPRVSGCGGSWSSPAGPWSTGGPGGRLLCRLLTVSRWFPTPGHTQRPSLCHPTLVFLHFPSQSTLPGALLGWGRGLASQCLISLPAVSLGGGSPHFSSG